MPRLRNRRGWILALVLLVVGVLVSLGLAPRLWSRGPVRDPQRLGWLHAAWNAFEARRYDQAQAILDRRAAVVAPTPLDWMLRARIAEAQGRPAEALDHLRRIPDSDPIAAQAWLKAGQIELARHQARAAEAAYRHALALNPDQIQAHRELAYLYILQRRKAECDVEFRALDRIKPLDEVLAFAWCQNFCRLWNSLEALPVLIRFVATDPDDRWSRLALAASYELINRLDEAESALGPLPDSDPDARALRILIAFDRGQIGVAAELARGGPAEHTQLNVCRGRLALQGPDPRQAAAFFRAALRQDPEDRDALQGLGLALRKLGDARAEQYLRLAFRQDDLKRTLQGATTTLQSDPRLFSRLGEICMLLDRREEARAWYRLAIGRDPLDTRAQQDLIRLENRSRAD
ncbi:MAG TPA: tetratricopeptide repeat protein [Isosphaeraceae bacterium]|nr:tetratricopeptide repeat protein [Isosphaeraceae bacterium]